MGGNCYSKSTANQTLHSSHTRQWWSVHSPEGQDSQGGGGDSISTLLSDILIPININQMFNSHQLVNLIQLTHNFPTV